jgi:hypothetical protein
MKVEAPLTSEELAFQMMEGDGTIDEEMLKELPVQ